MDNLFFKPKRKVQDIKIYLLDKEIGMVDAWNKYFDHFGNVVIVHQMFDEFMKTYKVEGIVSPSNSFGLMDGGYDLAISNWFGPELQKYVQEKILATYCGEQPVGTSFTCMAEYRHAIGGGHECKMLIHTPTMRYPQRIKDHKIVYNCMRSCLLEAMHNDMESVVIPAFGGACGDVPYNTIAYMMCRAYLQLLSPPSRLDWDYVAANTMEQKG